MRIAIDLMGGDLPPEKFLPAVLQVRSESSPSSRFILLVTRPIFDQIKAQADEFSLDFHLSEEVIAMDEDPIHAYRYKENATLFEGIRLLKNHEVDAFVTIGNTGALIAGATMMLPRLPNIDRPALLTNIPTERGFTAVLDVGGYVGSKAKHLLQYAYLGAAYYRCVHGEQTPKVGLLNIGTESTKGTKVVRDAYHLIKHEMDIIQAEEKIPPFVFHGNVEGHDVFKGMVDVLVTDGFSGNIFLKTSEGLSQYIFNSLQQVLPEDSQNEWHETLLSLQHQFSYAEYPAAIVCGIDGIIIKCHGYSSPRAIYTGIKGAMHLLQDKLMVSFKNSLPKIV